VRRPLSLRGADALARLQHDDLTIAWQNSRRQELGLLENIMQLSIANENWRAYGRAAPRDALAK
jgi:hypothetical protein